MLHRTDGQKEKKRISSKRKEERETKESRKERRKEGRKKRENVVTALLVLMSVLFFKCSRTLSKWPSRAARRKPALASDCKKKETKIK